MRLSKVPWLSYVVLLASCLGGVTDFEGAGASDAGTTDAGTTDAGTTDAGTTDAGTTDAGTTDAGTTDAGATDAGTADAGTTAPGCVHFHPGHYIRQVDSASRHIDGVGNITYDLTNNLAYYADFVGIVLQIDWAMLEPTKGNYDFSRVDTIMNLARSKGKVVRLKIMDRSFWDSCHPAIALVPAYVNQYPNVWGGVGCFADTWNKPTMDGYIALHIAAAKRYNNHSAFAGFNTEETAIAVANAVALSPAEYDERVRLAKELFAAVPQAILISEFNWPINNDLSVFTKMIDQSSVTGTGGPLNAMGVSWPDSYLNVSAYPLADQANFASHIGCTQSVASNGKVPCIWYNLARQYNSKTIVAPNLEGGVFTGALAEAEALYTMMDDDLHAHMITWDGWTGAEPDYLRKVAAPTIRNHGGRLKNSTCPFTGR